MSKSLQKGILFAVCILLVCALGVTLFIFDGTGGAVTGQEGQASNVAQNTAKYTHGSNIGRALPSDYTSVSDGTQLKAAIEANNKDIVLTNDVTLKTINPFWANNYLWNDNSQCFDSDGNGNTDLKVNGFTRKIYGQGYTIEVQGPHAATGEGMQQNSTDTNDYGGLFPKLGNNGAVYDAKIYITKGFSGQTQETSGGWGGNDEWLNVGGIAGSLIGNAVIDNVTVEIASGVKLASYKWCSGGSTSQYVRVGAIAGEINNTASISNVTVINNGRLESGQYISEAKFSPDSDRYYGAAGNVVGWISNATTSINNVRVEGSGTLYSYYVANIANAIGSTVSVNNFYNNFTGTFDANYIYSNTLGQGEGATSTLTVTNHYKKGALASTAGTDNTVRATNTLTVPNNLTLYFIPDATQDSERLGIAFSGTTYSSANDYTVTGLNNAEKTASGGFSAAPSGGTLALGLPVGANNWKTDGTFASITATPKFNPSSYAKLTKYDHGYVAHETTNSGTKITQDNFASYFQPGGQANNQSGTYYLTEDVVVTGFTGINFSGTFDGNGHTIFITGANTGMTGQHIGGIVGTLTGTIKNVRVVLVNSVTANTSVSNANVGLVAGHINGGSLINVSVDIPAGVTLSHVGTANDSSLGGVAGSAVSGATFTNVTMNFNGTLSNIKTSGASGGYWPFTSAFVGKPSVSQGTNSPANSATFNNIIIRGNGTFASQSSADDEPPYYAAIGIIQHKGVTNSTAAVYNVNGLIYDFNPQFADNQGATSGNHGACYGLFVNNNNNNAAQVQYYDRLVNYGSGGVYNASGKEIEEYAFNGNGNAPVPNPATNIKNITETVTNVTGSTVKAYFMPGDSASTDLTLVASASNWNGVTQLQLDGAAPAVTSADDGSNKVVNVAKSTAVNISGENLTLSPYNPYMVITASLVTDTKVYDGTAFVAQVSFAVGGSPLEGLTAGDDYNITYTDGNATGETNANASGGTYSLTVTLTGTANDGTQYVFDAQGTKTKTFTYTITPLEVTGTWSVSGLKITYGDAAPDYDQYISIELTNEGTIPGGLTATDITGSGFTSNYTSGTRAGETVTITAGTFTVGSGFTASNYNFRGITGSGSLEVQKKELTISESFGDSMGHITDNYGENVTTFEALADLFEAEGMSYVEGLYGSDVVTFTVTALTYDRWYNDGADGAWEFNADASSLLSGRLYGNTAYNVGVELASDNSVNDNYELTNSIFVYAILPLPITVTGVELEGFDGDYIYDGNAHNISVKYDGALQGDELTFGISVSYGDQPFDGTALTNAGEYTIDVSFDPQNAFHGEANYNYEIGVDGSENTPYTLTITPKTLTISDKSGVYTDFVAADIVIDDMVSGILEGDTEGVTVTPEWDTPLADENGYLAAGTYNATLSLSGDKSANYTFGSDSIATVTVDQFDLSGAKVTITSAPFTYNGNEQTVLYTVLTAEGGKDITALLTAEGDKQTNANAKYTVTLSGDDNFTGTATADWSIDQKTLTITPYEADFLDYDLNSLYAYLTSADSGFITGAVEGDTLTFLGTAWETETSAPPTNVEIDSKEYVKAGSYTLNMVLSGDSYTNYKFDNAAMSVTINALDISGAVVAWNESGLTYTAAEQSVSLDSVTVNGVALPVEWFNLTNNTGTDANTYTANIAANNSNITGSTDKEFTIAPYSVTVKWEVTGEISVGKVMPSDATKISDLGLTANVTEFNAPGITDSAQYSIKVAASGFDAGHTFAAGENVTLTPSMNFGQGAAEDNYDITFDPATIEKTVAATPVTVKPVEAEQTATYGSSVKNAEEFIAAAYFTIESGAEGSALTADNFTVTVTDSEGVAAVFGTHGLAAGTYTVTIEGKGAYSVSNEDNSFTYNVDRLTLTAGTWSGIDDLTYNGIAADPVFTPVGVGVLDGDSVTATVTVTGDKVTEEGQAINAGTYTATATSDNANYVFDGTINVNEFTIAQMVLKGDWEVKSDMDMTYDGTDKSAYVTWTWTTAPLNDGDVTFEITFNGEKTAVNAGNYTATVTFTDSTGNYDTQSGILQGNTFDEMTIKRRPVEITWTAPADLTYSATAKVPTATINNKVSTDEVTATITYNGDNTNVTADGFTATVTELTGDAKDNYTLEGGTNLTSEKYTITALDVNYEWSFADSAAITYGDGVDKVKALVTLPDGALTGTEEKVTFEVSVDYSETTSAGSTVTFTVTAKLPEGVNADNYNITVSAKDGNNTLTVDKAQITFTGNAVTEQKIVGETLKLTQKQLLASKYYTITPTPNDTYSVDGKLSVTSVKKGDAEITLGAEGYIFTEAGEYIVTYEITTADGDNYAPVSGTFTATLTVSEEAISLTPTWGEYTFTYDGTAQYPEPTFNQTPDEGAIVYKVTARGGSVLTDNSAVNAGEYTVTISVAEGFTQKYEFAEDATRTFDFTIGKLEAQLSWSDKYATYNGQAHILTATVANMVEGDDVTVEVKLVDGNDNINVTEQGFYFTAIGLNGTDAGNYKLPADVQSGKFEIMPAKIALTWNFVENPAVTYGMTVDKVKALVDTAAITATIPGAEAPLTFTVSVGEYTAATNAGAEVTFTVDYNLPEGAIAANYNITVSAKDGNNTLTVGKAQITFTGNNVTEQKIAGGTLTLTAEQLLAGKYYTIAPAPDSTYSVSGKLSVTRVENSSGQEITADANGYTFTEEGEYTVTYAVSSEESDNYAPAAETFTATLTVSEDAISLTPTWGEYTFTYNGEAQYPVPTFNQTPDEGAIVYTVTARGDSALTDNSAVNAGDYTVTISVKEGFEQKYEFAEDATLTFDFTIGQLEAQLTWSDEDATYDGQEHNLTATVANKVEGDEVTVEVELTDGDNTNVTEQGYYFTATGLTGAAAGNYKLPAEVRSGKFYIEPAELTVTTVNTSFTYGDNIDLGASVTTLGDDVVTVAIESVTVDNEAAELKNVGTYTVTYKLEGEDSGNYSIAKGGSVTVTITAKELNIIWSEETFTYNGSAQAPAYTADFIEGEEIELTVTITGEASEGQAINAGDYTATIAAFEQGNYKLTSNSTKTFTISPATVTAEDVQAVYGEVFTAAATDTELQRVGGWQIVTFNGKAVEVKVTVTDSTASAARAGEVYLDADTYEINIQLESSNFTFGASSAQTKKQLTVARKQLELAPELPSDLTYSSDGIVIGTPDHASQLVGDDAVEVTMLIDGQLYVAGETVLSAGEHTVTFEIKDASGNYDVADTSSSTFTVAKKSVTPSINVAGDKVENNSTLEMDKGENMRVETAIDNFIADNGIKEGEYTLSVKDASGADKKLDEIAAWAPGTYTVTVALGDNYDGSLTFSIVVKEGTTAQIPEPPALPSTPLEDSGSSLSTTDWLFPLIIAVECLIAAVLVAAIVIAAIKRSK